MPLGTEAVDRGGPGLSTGMSGRRGLGFPDDPPPPPPDEGMDKRCTHTGTRGRGARRTERGGRARRRLLRAPVGTVTPPEVDIPRPNSRRWGWGLPHRRQGVSAWMCPTDGAGRCPSLCGPGTEQ